MLIGKQAQGTVWRNLYMLMIELDELKQEESHDVCEVLVRSVM